MRMVYWLAVLLFVSVAARADGPIVVVIWQHRIEVEGVAYPSPAEAMQALKDLNPTRVRFMAAQNVPYQSVYAVLDAYRRSGIGAPVGMVAAKRK